MISGATSAPAARDTRMSLKGPLLMVCTPDATKHEELFSLSALPAKCLAIFSLTLPLSAFLFGLTHLPANLAFPSASLLLGGKGGRHQLHHWLISGG